MLFEARHSSKQIRLLLVQLRNQSFQNVPLIERHAYSRFGRLLHFRSRRVEESSNIHVSVFVVDRDVDASADVMMIVDTLAICVSFDVVVDIRDQIEEGNPSSRGEGGPLFRRKRFLSIF